MFTYLIIAISFICISVVTALLFVQKKRKKVDQSPYVDALHMLLEGKKEKAIDCLKRTVKKDTDNIMAYILLGDILREKGLPVRAIKIHRNLLIRGNLTDSQIETILHHLVLDYHANNMLEKAIEMAERLIQRAKRNIKNQELLLSLYEEKGDWDKAFSYQQTINKWLKRQDTDILALYRVYTGLDLIKQNAEKEGRIRFREAIKLDKKCIPAYLYMGDSYRKEDRNEEALKIWKEFTLKNPDWAHLAFDRLKEVLFDLGHYGEIEEIYRQVISKKTNDSTVYLNLAELYRKEGRLDEAVETCRHATEIQPDSIPGRYLLSRLYRERGDETTALEQIFDIMEKELEKSAILRCSNCGFESGDPLWRCPQCNQWKTFLNENPS